MRLQVTLSFNIWKIQSPEANNIFIEILRDPVAPCCIHPRRSANSFDAPSQQVKRSTTTLGQQAVNYPFKTSPPRDRDLTVASNLRRLVFRLMKGVKRSWMDWPCKQKPGWNRFSARRARLVNGVRENTRSSIKGEGRGAQRQQKNGRKGGWMIEEKRDGGPSRPVQS